MNVSDLVSPRPRRRSIGLAGAALVLAAVLAGCGSGGNKSAEPTTTVAPEQVLAPDREVTAGLHRLARIAGDVAGAAPGSDRANKAAAKLEPTWSKIEGTVKKKEPNMYARIEEDLALLGNPADASGKKATPARTKQGSRDLAGVVGSYLAKHP